MNKKARVQTKVLEDTQLQDEVQDQDQPQDKSQDQQPDAADGEEAAEEATEMTQWLVSVNCPTPLARNPERVHAFDEEGAWAVFCAMNGISDTEHAKSITQVE